MDMKKISILGIVLLFGLMLTGCAWRNGDDASPYYNLGSGFGYYGYPYSQGNEGGEQNPVFDEHHHHHH